MILAVRWAIASELVDSLKAVAEQGDATAQFNLGYMYSTGEGVPKNYTEAVRWYRMVAEQGDATAQFNLGYMYRAGLGVPKNNAEAARWYRMAARAGICRGAAQSGLHVFHRQRHSQGLRAGLCLVQHCSGARQRNGKGELGNRNGKGELGNRNGKGELGNHHKRNDDC